MKTNLKSKLRNDGGVKLYTLSSTKPLPLVSKFSTLSNSLLRNWSQLNSTP